MLETMTVGGGCFWCVDAVFREIKGVKSVTSGYMGGTVPGSPTYREVRSGLTGHAEVVQVKFDPNLISYEELLIIFMTSHDPTTLNRQGADVGTQYRSIIFYNSSSQEATAKTVIKRLQASFEQPIVTAIIPAEPFHNADEEHQNYFETNPEAMYCEVVIAPKIQKLRQLHSDKLKL